MTGLAVMPSKVLLDKTSLMLSDSLTAEEEEQLWSNLSYINSGSKWWLGDLFNLSNRTEKELLLDIGNHGLDTDRVKKIARVCKNVPNVDRREALYFEHHEIVHALEGGIEEIRIWLNKAEEGENGKQWSVRQLRAALGRAPHPGPPSATILEQAGLYKGDFREFDFKDIDLMLTDPPYDKDSLSLFDALAEKASEWLRPGGILVTYSGQFHLPEVYRNLSKYNLNYLWTFSIRHSGGNNPIMPRRLYCTWKPAIVYCKSPVNAWWDYFQDSVSGGKEKSFHKWQQAEEEAAYFIQNMCQEKGIVLDPMCGSGTVLAAAKGLNRRYIGIDIDAFALRQAERRLML